MVTSVGGGANGEPGRGAVGVAGGVC